MTRKVAVLFPRRGFTLIEVLVTASLFSMVMSVLLVGIFSGTRAWDRADRKMERFSQIRLALEQFREDVEHAQLGSGKNLESILDGEGRPVWQVPTLETRAGSAWQGGVIQVEWAFGEGDASADWIRQSQRLLGDELLGSIESEIMVEGIKTLTLEFRQDDAWVTVPETEASMPDRVRLRLTTEDGFDHEVVARLYSGIYDGTPGGSGNDDGGDPDDEGSGGDPEGEGEGSNVGGEQNSQEGAA